jgi:hypothetical protein
MGTLRRVVSWIEIGIAALLYTSAVLIFVASIVSQDYGAHGGHMTLLLSSLIGTFSVPYLCGGLGLRYLRPWLAVAAHIPLLALTAWVLSA